MPEIFFIPSKTWFPTTLAARLAWFDNFKAQFNTTYAAALGLSSYTTAVAQDNEDYQSIGATRLAAENFRAAIVEFMRSLCERAVGSPHPVFPAEAFAAPPNDVDAGIYQRLIDLRTLIMAQPAYTQEMGAALGIEPATPEPAIPGDVTPTIQVDEAQSGFLFTTIVKGREESDAWQLKARLVGETTWTTLGTFTGRSADATWPGGGTSPVQIEVRVQLRKDNADYGLMSDIKVVTLNP